jgi:quercetin dioxygenase-like cupin family protein
MGAGVKWFQVSGLKSREISELPIIKEVNMQKITVIKEAVKYSAGSVVSQTVVEKKTGTVTLFAFDKGQGLSEHSAPFDALAEILDGAAVITIGGEEHKLKAGEYVIMPANVPHALKAVEKFKMLLIMIKG